MKSKTEYRIDPNGDRIKRLESSYNEAGKLIREAELFSSGAILFEKFFEYNDAQKLVKEKVWNEMGTSTETSFEYDDEGQLALKILLHPDGAEEKERRTTEGSITTVESFDEDGKLVEKNVSNYDDKSRAVSSDYYDGETIVESHTNSYDESDHLIGQEILVHQTGAKMFVKFSFGSNDKIASTVSTNDEGDLIYRFDYSYENELLIEEKAEDYQYQPRRDITKHRYDENGNLITKTITDFDGNVKVEVQIEYNDQNDIIAVTSAGQQYGDNVGFAYEIEYHPAS